MKTDTTINEICCLLSSRKLWKWKPDFDEIEGNRLWTDTKKLPIFLWEDLTKINTGP